MERYWPFPLHAAELPPFEMISLFGLFRSCKGLDHQIYLFFIFLFFIFYFFICNSKGRDRPWRREKESSSVLPWVPCTDRMKKEREEREEKENRRKEKERKSKGKTVRKRSTMERERPPVICHGCHAQRKERWGEKKK